MPTLDWTKFFLDFIQTFAIVVGGLYTLYEYRRFRRYYPKIQFEVDFDIHPIGDETIFYLLNIKLIVKNLGYVRKEFPKILVGVKTINKEDLETGLRTHKRLKFSCEHIPKHNIVFKPDDPWWVDPGITQVFPFPVVINKPGDFVQVNAEFYYYKHKKEEAYQQASRVKPIAS